MNQWFSSTCDRYGHLITVIGGSSLRMNRLFDARNAEQIRLVPRVTQSAGKELKDPRPQDSVFQNAEEGPPVRRMLIPIDAEHVKPADLKPILKLARHFDAEVTLLHCYTTPPSFDYAIGPSAMREVNLHRNMARARLLKLCSDVQKFFSKCACQFTFGSLLNEILRASERLQADLIAVPLSLDFASHCWTTKDLMDELVRRANCPVLGVPSGENG
jgi:nucleotide-binding universal stress UspA family protein